MFCRNGVTAKQIINNCKTLLSQHKLQPIGNGWFQFRYIFRSSRHRGKRSGFEPDPLEHFHIDSGPLQARGLVKPFLFTIGVSTVSLAGCVIWEYENLRFHASNLLRRPGTWLSIQQKKLMGHKSEGNPVKKWWNSLKDSEKVFYPILAANVLVFGGWRVRALQPFMVKYFCSNPSGRAICLPMLLSTFSHYSALHLAANMYVLYSFMPAAIASLGKEQFVAMYLSAGVVSSFASFMYKIMVNQPGLSLGASGAIMAVLSYVCVQYPDTRLSIIFLPMYTFAAGSAIKVIMGIDLAGVMFGWKVLDHAAHLGGALFGICVYALQYSSWFVPTQQLNTNNKELGFIPLSLCIGVKGELNIPLARQSEINTTTSPLPIEEKKQTEINIDQALAKAIYVSGAPLSLLEHPLWKGALNLLNPLYTPPSLKALSTTLLEKIYADVQTVAEQTIKKASAISLEIDGWRNNSVLKMLLYAPMPLVFKYFGESYSTDFVLQKVLEIMKQFGANNFIGIVADNAENMIKCGELIVQKYPHVVWMACLLHTFHLLLGEIMKSSKVEPLYSQIVDIINTIMRSSTLKARFMKLAEENNVKDLLVLPVLDDWESYVSCLHNFLASKPVLQKMANEGFQQLHKYKMEISDESTWQKLNKLEEFLLPFNKWILTLKNDNSSVHLVHKALKELTTFLNNPLSSEVLGEDLKAIIANFNEKKKNVLKPIHFAAAILDPKNHGSDLTNAEYQEGIKYITEILKTDDNSNVEIILQDLNNYENRTDSWQKESIWQMVDKVSPLEWWQSLESKNKLGELAMKILSVPATSNIAENTLANISANKQNMPNYDVAEKIEFISQNWGLTNAHNDKSMKLMTNLSENVLTNISPNTSKQNILDDDGTVRIKLKSQYLDLNKSHKSESTEITIDLPKSLTDDTFTFNVPDIRLNEDDSVIKFQPLKWDLTEITTDSPIKSNDVIKLVCEVLNEILPTGSFVEEEKSNQSQISTNNLSDDSNSITTDSSDDGNSYYHRHYKEFY